MVPILSTKSRGILTWFLDMTTTKHKSAPRLSPNDFEATWTFVRLIARNKEKKQNNNDNNTQWDGKGDRAISSTSNECLRSKLQSDSNAIRRCSQQTNKQTEKNQEKKPATTPSSRAVFLLDWTVLQSFAIWTFAHIYANGKNEEKTEVKQTHDADNLAVRKRERERETAENARESEHPDERVIVVANVKQQQQHQQ